MLFSTVKLTFSLFFFLFYFVQKREDLSNILFPRSYIYSGRAEGWACNNPLVLQFVGRKQEVGKSCDYSTFHHGE